MVLGGVLPKELNTEFGGLVVIEAGIKPIQKRENKV